MKALGILIGAALVLATAAHDARATTPVHEDDMGVDARATPLHDAAKNGALHTVEALVKAGAGIEARDII